MPQAPSPFSTHVVLLLTMAMFSSSAISSVEWTALPYLRHIHFATSLDVSFYILTSAIIDLAPVICNPVLGKIVARIGSAKSIGYTLSVVATGMALLLLNRTSRPLFLFSWACYATNNAVRLLRIGFLAELVPSKSRTSVLAMHQLASPVGDAIGASIWLAIQYSQASLVLMGKYVFDSFSLVYSVVFLGAVASSIVSFTILRNAVSITNERANLQSKKPEQGRYGAIEQSSEQADEVLTGTQAGEQNGVDSEVERQRWVKVYALGAMLIASRFTSSMTAVAFQPLMINQFKVSNHALGTTYVGLSLFNFFPTLGMAALARRLEDRYLMLIGSVLKLVAGMLFLPVFGAIGQWQVVAGFIVVETAGMFFTTATMSQLTKCFRGKAFADTIGILWSLSALFTAAVKIGLRKWVTETFGRWVFGVFLVPGALVLLVSLLPNVWGLLE